MSDFGATSGPQSKAPALTRELRAIDKPNSVESHGKDADSPATGQRKAPDQQQASDQKATSFRDPAVSIDASVAHIQAGDIIRETILHLDSENRPIIDTDSARFALRPDAGLRPSDQIELKVIRADTRVEADLVALNGKQLDPPFRLQMIVIGTHQTNAPYQQMTPSSSQQPFRPEAPAIGSLAESAEKIMKGLQALSGQQKQSLTDFLSLLPNVTSNSRPIQNIEDPLILKTSSEDMKTILALQAEAGLSKKMALLSHLNSMPQPATRLAFQAIPLFNKGLPQLITLIPNTPMQGEVTERIIAQVAVPEQALQTFGLNQQSLTHPVYQLVTTKGDFIAALPEMLDVRGMTVSVKNLTPPSAAPHPTAVQSGAVQSGAVQSTAVPSAITSPTGMPISAVMIAPDGQRSAIQFSSDQANSQTALIRQVSAGPVKDTPEGMAVPYQLTTPLGTMVFTLPETTPLPFKEGDRVSFVPLAPPPPSKASVTAQTTPLAPAPLQSAAGWPAMNALSSLADSLSPLEKEEISQLTAGGGGALSTAAAYMMAASLLVKEAGGDLAQLAQHLLPQQMAAAVIQQKDAAGLFDQFVKDIFSVNRRVVTGGTSAGEWRGMVIPSDPRDSSLSLFAFLFKTPDEELDEWRGKNSDDDEPDRLGRRDFIIEVDFSEFGPLQVQGVLYPGKLSLTIETLKPFSEAIVSDLTALFDKALKADHMQGKLTFTCAEKFDLSAKELLSLA